MRFAAFTLLSSCGLAAVAASGDFYFWNYLNHPYQTYYLEDYCGPPESTACSAEGHTVYLNSTGSGSAVVIRGFRASRPKIAKSLKCCITVKTIDLSRFNVQLDEVYLKQKRIGEKCENFLRFHGLEEELGHVCSEIDKYSFRTPQNVMEVDYVLNAENAPDFQKVKLVVTSTTDVNKMQGGRCSAEEEQWQCDNGSCIWSGFRCDTHNNCGDWSDELYCGFYSRYWPVFLGVICAIFAALLAWCVCRCCCCCLFGKKSSPLPAKKPFQFVSSLRPDARLVPQGELYPSLDTSYQNSAHIPHVPAQIRSAPPPYNENAFFQSCLQSKLRNSFEKLSD